MPPGQHVLASRYNHATGGRDAQDDTYRADAGTAAGALAVRGGFAPDGVRAAPISGFDNKSEDFKVNMDSATQ